MKYCPNKECPHLIRTGSPPEYIAEIMICPDCHTDLLEGEVPVQSIENKDEVSIDSPLVQIASYREPYMAGLAKSKLESEGIPAFVEDQHLVGVMWLYSNAIGGVKVLVPASQAQEAYEILGLDEAHEEATQESDLSCPECGSGNISEVVIKKRSGIISSIFFNLPFVNDNYKNKCNACNHSWEQ